jgi:hypothetical protein
LREKEKTREGQASVRAAECVSRLVAHARLSAWLRRLRAQVMGSQRLLQLEPSQGAARAHAAAALLLGSPSELVGEQVQAAVGSALKLLRSTLEQASGWLASQAKCGCACGEGEAC